MNFERLQNVGHLFITIRPDLFMPQAKFLERMDTLIKRMKAQPKANGFDEILVPGEREARTQAQRLHSGIPLIAEVVSSLKAEGERADIAFPRISNTPLQ
jgi:LDH2 family malate/lactate/ureidoglycolate dehydrogenase